MAWSSSTRPRTCRLFLSFDEMSICPGKTIIDEEKTGFKSHFSGSLRLVLASFAASFPEVSGILELGNVWVYVQLIHRPMRTKNQLHQKPNIAQLLIPLLISLGRAERGSMSSRIVTAGILFFLKRGCAWMYRVVNLVPKHCLLT